MNIKIKAGLLMCLLILSSHLHAQITVIGKVTDKLNKPIEFANVILLDSINKEIIFVTTTNKNGNFTIKTKKNGPFFMRISFVGFETYTNNINTTIDLGKIILYLSNELNEIKITARKKIIERKEDKIIFYVQNTSLNKGNDGIEVLQNAPNIWISNTDMILIRQEPATILVNGRKINLTGADLSNYIKNLNSENIQRIEIQTYSSANIDAKNTGGIVNIILKKNPLGFNSNLKTYYTYLTKNLYTTYNGFSANYGSKKWNSYLLYNFKKDKGAGVFNSEIFIKQNQQSQLTEGDFGSDKVNHNYKLGFVAEIAKNQSLGAEFYGNNNCGKYDSENYINIAENAPVIIGYNTSDNISNKYIYNGILNYTYKIDTLNGKLNIIADYLKHNLNSIGEIESYYELGSYDNNVEKNTTNSITDIYNIQVDFEKKYINKLKINSGVKFTSTNRINELLSEFYQNGEWLINDRTTKYNYNENISAAYILLGKNIDMNFFKLGLRFENTYFIGEDKLVLDKVKNNYSNWFPSVFYSLKLKNKKSISFSYSRRLRRPSFNTLNNRINKINDFRYDIGNPNLKPEFINKLDISFSKKNQSISIYLNKTLDAINGVWSIENDIAYHQNLNYGTRNQFGIEYNASGNIFKWWYVKGIGEVYNKHFTNSNYNLNKTTAFFYLYNNFKINKTTNVTISGNYMSPALSANSEIYEQYSIKLIIKKSFFKDKLNMRIYMHDILNSIKNQSKSEFIDFNFDFYQKRQTRGITFWITYNFTSKNKVKNNRNKSDNKNRNRL